MGVRIEKVDLPGIGTRHDIVTEDGRRIGIVSHRTGERELAVFDDVDPDACRERVSLSEDEALALADVLGASVMLGQLAGIREQAAGLFTEQLLLPASSPFVGGRLGDTKARTLTGTSIVAIVRDSEVVPSPTPQTELRAGDTLIVVGTRPALETLARLLADGTLPS
ncbi:MULTISPECIES: cation:proton antiporter regulatory subunit [unclassified Microcella]|uniref:cation:proton antiporter regulatory subunit n=1 Tax=unclassified Microcella TaxID=2630066 RepID=UPI0006FB2333|nr:MULTISPECIES: cation:proton antiporter regulatory subunit [unclassified Microcella]KQV26905.1 potassium transporter TrkA [Yonghaparkia sp. Root332]KRF32590.1 potassium transporter TrkA [Yonghaparkia sp. Soil809]